MASDTTDTHLSLMPTSPEMAPSPTGPEVTAETNARDARAQARKSPGQKARPKRPQESQAQIDARNARAKAKEEEALKALDAVVAEAQVTLSKPSSMFRRLILSASHRELRQEDEGV
jgi:hypothetical protein